MNLNNIMLKVFDFNERVAAIKKPVSRKLDEGRQAVLLNGQVS